MSEDFEREEMPVDALFVGGGPACLAGAIHLMDLIEAHNETADEDSQMEEPMICLIEKGSEIGSHAISGAVLDPRALEELLPDWRDRDFPVERWVEHEEMIYLTEKGAMKAPMMPPPLHDMGMPIISIGRFQKWLAEIAEEKGVMIFPGFAGDKLLWDEDGKTVIGVRCGDKGVGPDGEPKDTFEPGMDLESPVTIIGEGPRGHLARQLISKLGLDADSQPQVYEIGVKEVLELPEGTVKQGGVTLTMGYPLNADTFGGAFIYTMGGDRVCVGMMVGLDAPDPSMDAHYMLQQLKNHPKIRERLKGGKVIKYGAKTVTVGGWASMPKLYAPGAMIVGDSASFLNPQRIKGIHLSMKSGILAADAAFEAMKRGEATEEVMKLYKEKLDASWVREEMEPQKNFHQAFEGGRWSGLIKTGMQMVFGPGKNIKPFKADYAHMAKANGALSSRDDLTYDGEYLVDKLTDVYLSGTKHDEHQPCHLKIEDTNVCATRCAEEYGNPCERFCPAQVYNMVMNEETGRKEMQVDFSNCVHCKTCDIRDPYQIIRWVPPEGGDGPEYGFL